MNRTTRSLAATTALVALTMLLGSARPSVAEPGALTQLPLPAGCLADTGDGIECIDGFALDSADAGVVSPDGKHVYVAAQASDAVAVLARDKQTGALTPAGCISETGSGGACTDGVALNTPRAVAISPDGKHVYVAAASSSAVVALARDKVTGLLTPAGCVSDTGSGGVCTDGIGLSFASHVAVSPDGKHVYVTAELGGAVTTFARNATTGALTQLPAPTGCLAATGDGGLCSAIAPLATPGAVTVSKDGKHVYVTDRTLWSVLTLTRNKATGALTQPPLPTSCIAYTNGDGCLAGVGFGGAARHVTVTPDGKHVYVAAGGVVAFARDKTTGLLTQLAGTAACVSDTGSGGACADGVGIDGAQSVVVSPDGKSVYVASGNDATVTAFARNKTTGALTQLPGVAGCTGEAGDGITCGDGTGLGFPVDVTISKDGKHVYVVSAVNTVAIFAREK